MENFFGFLGAYYIIPAIIAGTLGFLLGWFLKPSKVREGDLSIEGEGALRAEADSLRARVQDLEGRLFGREGEVSDLKAQLASSASAADAASADVTAKTTDTDDTYALEWQNRYLAARVKYLDSRLAEMGDAADAPKAKAPAKKASKTKAVAAPKKTAVTKAKTTKAVAKAAPKPKVLYTDGPTDGAPDDLKKIKGIGPKFEKDLNDEGIYYYRQIGAWKAKDVKMVEGVIDSIPGRIQRDEWVKQAKGFAKGAGVKASTVKAKPVAKKATKAASDKDAAFEKYYEKVKAYDARASRKVVQNIVDYCGISLKSRDSSLVACSDEAELKRVAKGFVTKKLGLEDGQMDLVKSVCEEMKGQRLKSRVTFYYLAAKKAKKLSLFK